MYLRYHKFFSANVLLQRLRARRNTALPSANIATVNSSPANFAILIQLVSHNAERIPNQH